jgi:hypothetical protein
MPGLPITRVVLFKHGVGYFERSGDVEGEAVLTFTFKQAEVSDVLKSLTVLDLGGGHISSVSYDSTKPLEQLLAEVALSIPDQNSLVGLLPQIKGARVAFRVGSGRTMSMAPSTNSGDAVEGLLLGVDTIEKQGTEGKTRAYMVSLLTDDGQVRAFDLQQLSGLEILDPALRKDLEYYLRTQLSAKKKESRTFTFFAQGQGTRGIRLSYTVEAPVWKATYRIILGEEGQPPMIQGWAVVDNTQDEDWDDVQLSLIAGLPVSFVHDLYTPRYIKRPEVKVRETTGVLPPEVEGGIESNLMLADVTFAAAGAAAPAASPSPPARVASLRSVKMLGVAEQQASLPSSTPTQTRERQLGDLFEYEIEHLVTIRRNQSALVPIVLRPFEGKPVLLYNKQARAENPMRCVEFKNTTGLTLEGGPVTVLEGGSYVGEAMLETTKPDDKRLVPYAVELGVTVLDNVDSHNDAVHRVVIRRGMLWAHYMQVIQTTYHFNNKSDTAQTLHLDHHRPGGEWTLFDTSAPQETTENYWRFQFPLPGKQVTRFVVRQKLTLQQTHGLGDLAGETLSYWIDHRYLDANTAQVLRQVVDLRGQQAGIDTQIQRLEQERNAIHAEQKRIRENLQSLGDRPSEKELRERFVRTLGTQEDRLESISRELETQRAAREQCRAQIQTLLGKLEYEAEVK